jgi:hypothetical protein
MSDLFSKSTEKSSVILLIDASGSVLCPFDNATIFDYIQKIVSEIEEDEFRIIFWNSDQNRDNLQFDKGYKFTTGLYKLPFVVKKTTLNQTFAFVKNDINNTCLTFPHIAFDNIPNDWISNNKCTKIYFITDGKMGYAFIPPYELNNLKNNLSDAIKKITTKYNNVQLNIVTVEHEDKDFDRIETLQKAAGCDVYNIVMDNRLTKHIAKFISYTPNNLNGFVHINKNIPPSGYIPFEDKYFSETRVNEFIKYLTELMKNVENENELIKIVQNLTSSLCYLTKDKPKSIIKGIIRTFCELFNKTNLDPMFVKFILTDAIEKENEGMANIFTLYRAQLKDLYKQANELLYKNVKDAIGIKDSFMTFPIDNKIISGHANMIDNNLCIDKNIYSQSSVKINDSLIPIIPFKYANSSHLNEQCLRQWTRQIISKIYNVNIYDDLVIHIVLGIVLKVVLSSSNDNVKNSFRQLGIVMLKKKRMNTDITELEKLRDGELPLPNSGKIETFYNYMNSITDRLGFKKHYKPFTLWYAICLATNDELLINKQFIHCQESLDQDFPNIDPKKLLSKMTDFSDSIEYHKIPVENILDYKCLITLDDISNVGGYRFLSHSNEIGTICNPIYVLSEDGHEKLLSNINTSVCPICYTKLNKDNFEKVGPKPNNELNIFSNKINIFGPKNILNREHSKNTDNLSKKGTIIVMKGTVGCGKSTLSTKIKEYVENKGGYCIVEGTDKYCKNGISIQDAVKKVKTKLLEVNNINNENIVVVIDTCNERYNKNNVFGINFSQWKQKELWVNYDRNNLDGYLAWTLRNVMRRVKPSINDNYYLNPIDAGIDTCISVHKRKIGSLLGKPIQKILEPSPKSIIEAIQLLDDKANEYEKSLKSNDEVIKNLFC